MKKRAFAMALLCACGFIFAEKGFTAFNADELEVSSFLVEGKTEYSKECLSPAVKRPWVPAGGNNGKGESITIKECSALDIYISIGYVSKERPDLFQKNSRPKKVRVQFVETGKTKEFALKDTAEPQQLKLIDSEADFFKNPRNTLVLTFPEVYEGSKYKDLCVNFIGVKNVFSGCTFDYLTECDDFVFNFGADSAKYREKAGNPVMNIFKEVSFKYAHNKDLSRLYLVIDKVVFAGESKVLDKSSALSFIENADMKTLKNLEYTYNRQGYSKEQWAEVKKSLKIRIASLFESPVAYALDLTNTSVELFPVTKYFDERLFASLILGNRIYVGSCDDTILIYGFWGSSQNVPNGNVEPEHFDANYELMHQMNKSPDKNGYYSFVVGFANPAVIKYKVSGKIDKFSWPKYTFDFIYPDGTKQTGYLDPNAVVFYLKGGIDSEFLPKDAVWK